MHRSRWLLRILGLYVLAQFGWWAYLLTQSSADGNVLMVFGEGSVFACLLVLGLIRLDRGLRRDEVRIKRDRHFMRAVTHELKTPLSTIQLGVDTLKRVSLSEEDTGRVIEGMQRGVEALNHRVEDILVASKLNRDAPLVLTSFHWSDIVHEALGRLDNHPGVARIQVFEESEGAGQALEGDRALLTLALGNLLDNALRHTEGAVEVRWGQDERSAWFKVLDEGNGIPKSQWNEVTQPFVSLSKDTSGTGLGLYLAKATAEAHKAQLLMNHPNPGFEVAMVWPLTFA